MTVGKPPKKPARKHDRQKRKFVAKLNPKDRTKAEHAESVLGSSFHSEHRSRSSSEDSYLRLVQYNPTIYESEEEEDFTISEESYLTLQDQKKKIETRSEEVEPIIHQEKISVSMPVSVQNNLSELDTLLADLSNARYTGQENGDSAARSVVSTTYAYGDYYSDLESCTGEKPPSRPPPPSGYGPAKAKEPQKSSSVSSSPVPSIAAKIHRRRPPKLMHILKDGERRVHDLAKEARDDDTMDIDVPDDGTDYDYSWKDYGSVSNYSTLRTATREEYDYATLDRSPVPVSEEELEKSTGAGPRGDRSKVIETDHGEVQSKYRYMGFGLWENTDPTAPKKQKKPSPPPPPPKAEPVMYTCTVSVSKTISSKELDDLVMGDNFGNMERREVEVADGVGDLGAGIGEPFEMFEKEDMSDMFKRAMLEKMQLVDEPPAKYKCLVCSSMIQGRIITAMGNKFHPHCFVCTYCRKEFKDRKYKTDPRDCKPYCFGCFEKLLGHYGSAHG